LAHGAREIYVIEDDPRLLAAVAGVLEEVDFTVRAFARAELALEPLLHDPPAVVITDEQLPGMPGHQLMREVRERLDLASPRFLLVTGADVPHAIAAGFDGVLYKPFRLDELLAQTRRLIQRRHRSGTQLRGDVGPFVNAEEEETG
jgi:DNA-binding response OmpR family regulator